MCGVAGIFAYHYAANPADRDELRRIRDHMINRGPDGSGEWFSQDGRMALGHRRLSIIDLSPAGAQPMQTTDGSLVISFNGEIYNYRVLRQKLEAKGVRFQSQSDTEVLLHLYAEKGVEMLHDLRGMFAFALWDARKQALLLARDPYGIKPLYYADDGWTCRVASQVKALLAGGKVARDPEPAGILGFYLFGHVPEPHTLYQEIRSVPAGSYLWVNEFGARAPQTYFSIAQTWADAAHSPRSSGEDPQNAIRSALLDSVRHHLVADVPVGAFLSAGVDSGALVGLMRDAGQKDIQTITVAFEEFSGSQNDEAPLAALTARHYGVQHHVRRVSEKEFHDDLPKIFAAMDQPTIDGINTWFVAKATHEHGLKVAISGLGGDELFGSYPSFRNIPRSVRLLSAPSLIPGAGDIFRWLASAPLKSFPKITPKLAGLLKYGGSYAGAYFLQRGLFMPWELKDLLDPELLQCGLKRLRLMDLLGSETSKKASAFGRVAGLEASLYMRNQLLRDTDWAGMSHSVEVRTPLVDSQLLATLAPVLTKGADYSKKYLAVAPSTPLPQSITNRPKTGFVIPMQRWMQKQDGDIPPHNDAHWSRNWVLRVIKDFSSAGRSRPFIPTASKLPGRQAKKILIFRVGSIGDTVVALPALRQIVAKFPNAARTLLTNIPVDGGIKAAPLASVLEGTGIADNYIAYPPRLSGVRPAMRLLLELRRQRFDLLIYLMPKRTFWQISRDWLFFRAAGIKAISGMHFSSSTQTSHPTANGLYEHEAQRLLRCIGIPTLKTPPPASWNLSLTATEKEHFTTRFDLPATLGDYAIINIGGKPQVNQWGQDHWAEWAKRLSRQFPTLGLVVIGAESERTASQHVLDAWSGKAMNLCGRLTPRASAVAIQQANIFVGHDSGPMHLASSVGTPVVGIFSARNHRGIWYPLGANNEVLYHSVPCAGCGLNTCEKYASKCITSITVDEVLSACERLLDSKRLVRPN